MPILKSKRATLRSNITRFATAMNDSTEETMLEVLEHYRNRLQETLNYLTSLDESIHGLLNDAEYATDVESCEEYTDSAKRAILKATRAIVFCNKRGHWAQDCKEVTNVKVLYHPPFSPDISPCDFDLIPKVKELLRGRRFKTIPDIIDAV